MFDEPARTPAHIHTNTQRPSALFSTFKNRHLRHGGDTRPGKKNLILQTTTTRKQLKIPEFSNVSFIHLFIDLSI